MLKSRFKLNIVHVPFKGSSPALVAMMSGEVDMGTMAVPGAIPIIRAGKVRAARGAVRVARARAAGRADHEGGRRG